MRESARGRLHAHQTAGGVKRSMRKRLGRSELRAVLSRGPAPREAEVARTKERCVSLLAGQTFEERTGFGEFLREVLRYSGWRMWILQGAALLAACMGIFAMPGFPAVTSAFAPVLVLACIPALLQGRIWGMEEIEASTRASGSQILFAKLILAGGADLVFLTLMIFCQAAARQSGEELLGLVLYTVVPFLTASTGILRCLRRRSASAAGAGLCLGISLFWSMLGLWIPQAYQASATGVWLTAFVLFSVFFGRELYEVVLTARAVPA